MDVLLEIDGPDVHAGTLDAVAALELASAYFALLRQAGEGERVRLEGLSVLDKCAALAVSARIEARADEKVDEATRILSLLDEVDGIARGEPAPPGGEQLARRLRLAIRGLPAGQRAKVIAGPWQAPRWQRPLETTQPERLDVEETVELRVRIIGVGGEKAPKVRLVSGSEPAPFALGVDRAMAKRLGKLLYDELDLTAIVRRRPDLRRQREVTRPC